MTRALRDRRVPMEEISLLLGHIHDGDESRAMTKIYAPDKPEYCKTAIAAIDEIMTEMSGLMKTPKLNDPMAVHSYIDSIRYRGRHLSERQRFRMRQLIPQGLANGDIGDLLNLPESTVSTYRQSLGRQD